VYAKRLRAPYVPHQCMTALDLGELGTVAMRGKIGRRRGQFSVAVVYGVRVPLSGSGRGVAESLHQVLECRASGGGQGLPSVA